MGRDKRFLQVEGQTLLKRTVDLALSVCREAAVLIADQGEEAQILQALGRSESDAGGHSEETAVEARLTVLSDSSPANGPLAAVIGAAAQCRSPWVLVLAVDYPSLTSDFLQGLLQRAAELGSDEVAVIPDAQGRMQYTCAVYRQRMLADLANATPPPSCFRSWTESLQGLVMWSEAEWSSLASADTLVNWNRPGDWNPPAR